VGKYWAVQLLARLSVVFAGLFAAGGFVWLVFTMGAMLSIIPLSSLPFGAVLGATVTMGNLAIAITLFFGALTWLVYGQVLLMLLELTENSRFLRKLGKEGEQPPTGARFMDAPWMRKTY
jgi:hypothetical protein